MQSASANAARPHLHIYEEDAIAVVVVAIGFNTILYRKLPFVEGMAMIAHVLGFFAFVIVLWYGMTTTLKRRRS